MTALISSLAFLMLQDQEGGGGGGSAAGAGLGIVGTLIYFAIIVVVIIGIWKVFEKAGEPGWASIIPFYNYIVMLKVAGRPWWWLFILWLVIPWFIMFIDMARKFGKGTGFGIGLAILPFIFLPILGFGDAKYNPAG